MPSPKSPVASLGLNSLIAFTIHSLGFGSFREQVLIDDAENKKKTIQKIKINIKEEVFCGELFPSQMNTLLVKLCKLIQQYRQFINNTDCITDVIHLFN